MKFNLKFKCLFSFWKQNFESITQDIKQVVQNNTNVAIQSQTNTNLFTSTTSGTTVKLSEDLSFSLETNVPFFLTFFFIWLFYWLWQLGAVESRCRSRRWKCLISGCLGWMARETSLFSSKYLHSRRQPTCEALQMVSIEQIFWNIRLFSCYCKERVRIDIQILFSRCWGRWLLLLCPKKFNPLLNSR